MFQLNHRMEIAFSATIKMIAPPEPIGETPNGIQMNFYFSGGELHGPELHGVVRPVGGDNFIVRRDGIGVIDMRTTFESNDGSLISAHHSGYVDLGVTGYEDVLARRLPNIISGRVVAKYSTGSLAHEWLNRVLCLGILEINRLESTLKYDIYAVR